MKKLLAGAWVGEFGWELFCWQGYVRNLSKDYNEVIIVTRPGNGYLYEDFADKIIYMEAPTKNANMWLGDVNPQVMNHIINEHKPTHHLQPFNIGYSSSQSVYPKTHKFKQQKYKKYKSDSLDKEYDILLHARNKIIGSNRNWEYDNWQNLVDQLKVDFTIATIGSKEAYGFEGVDDYRNEPIENTVSLMNRTKIVVGQSSGAIHLASLCGTAHLVWSDDSNYHRYKEHWNPFNTDCIFYKDESWNPKVSSIYYLIKEYFHDK